MLIRRLPGWENNELSLGKRLWPASCFAPEQTPDPLAGKGSVPSYWFGALLTHISATSIFVTKSGTSKELLPMKTSYVITVITLWGNSDPLLDGTRVPHSQTQNCATILWDYCLGSITHGTCPSQKNSIALNLHTHQLRECCNLFNAFTNKPPIFGVAFSLSLLCIQG